MNIATKESVIDRVYRYAQALPADEPIAILESEVKEFLDRMVTRNRFSERDALSRRILEKFLRGNGKLQFLGHQVVVLK